MNKLLKKSKFVIVATSLLALTSCGSTSNKTTIVWWNNYQEPEISASLTEEQARASSTYKEYYWAKDLIAEFETAHPNIHVETVYKGSYSNIVTAVKSALNTGDTPNIASGYGDAVATYDAAGASLDMSSFIDDANLGFGKKSVYNTETKETTYVDDSTTSKADFNASYLSLEKGMYNGKYLSLPFSKSSETLVVNQSVFDKVGAGECGTTTYTTDKDGNQIVSYAAPVAASTKAKYEIPTNWVELIQTARKMKDDFPEVFANQRDENGYFTAVPFCWDSTQNMIISLFKNMGIPYTNGAGNTVSEKILFNNDKAKALLKQLKAWNDEGLICTQDQLPITNVSKGYHDYSSNMAAKGKIFMSISSTAGTRYYAADGFTSTFNAVPSIDEGIYTMTAPTTAKAAKVISQGPSLTFFKKSDDVKDAQHVACWEFYKFVTNTTNSANLAVSTSYFPLRASSYTNEKIVEAVSSTSTKVEDSTAKADKTTHYSGEVFKLNTTYTNNDSYFLSDVFDLSDAARTAVGNMLDEVFDTKVTDTKTIDDIVNAAVQTAYNKLAA